jgi:pyruvate,water dikinase
MIDADRSGVMFTCDPATGSPHKIAISSLYGAGEGLVSAGLDADTYLVDKDTFDIDAEIAVKTEQLLPDEGASGGLKRGTVAADDQKRSSLTDAEIRKLARVGLQTEQHFRRPQDIEFCFAGDQLYVLQSRPVTNVEQYGPAAGNHTIWDNSNIIESYSGVTSPLTFSFIRRAYSIVYDCFAEVMGISPRVVRNNRGTFDNMLGLIRGRVYYNLRNWYRLIRGIDDGREGIVRSGRPRSADGNLAALVCRVARAVAIAGTFDLELLAHSRACRSFRVQFSRALRHLGRARSEQHGTA